MLQGPESKNKKNSLMLFKQYCIKKFISSFNHSSKVRNTSYSFRTPSKPFLSW